MEKTTTTKKKSRAPTAQKKKPQPSASTSASAHPPYFQMIKEAILALNERTGSSPYAIAKYTEEKHKGKLPENFRKLLAVQLKNCTVRGKLIKVKASFKLSSSVKQEAKKVTKDVKPKAEALKHKKQKIASVPAKRKAAAAPKKPAAIAKGAKKPTAAKVVKGGAPVMAKPKSIKAPAAKRARKTVA